MKSIVKKPWGSYQVINEGKNFLVKKIYVNANSKLSLQSHEHRSEHWIIVEGVAEVTIDSEILVRESNQSIYIPRRAKHRLSNNHDDDLIVIEVWYGENLDEEDITRYEDIYNRV
tara:strand:- start:244 stop:588 length:345 start_codon:yes stop_codon:yes gene_type:complete